MNKKRLNHRYDCDLPVRLVDETDEHDGRASNISLGGMSLTTAADLAYGTPCRVRVHLPATRETTEVAAVVRWRKGRDVGLQFTSLRAKDVWAINQFFRRVATSEASAAKPQ